MSRLERRPDWRTEFSAAGPAREMAERLAVIRADVREGRIIEAREALSLSQWRDRLDPAGIPVAARERAQRLSDKAWDALREPNPDPTIADEALRRAIGVFTPGGRAPE